MINYALADHSHSFIEALRVKEAATHDAALIQLFLSLNSLGTSSRAQWLRGRASDPRLRGPVFESCVAVLLLKPWASFSLYMAPVHSVV